MKTIALAFGLASGLAANLFAGDTLRLKLEPDRDYVLSGSPREVVVKIDLAAIDHKTKSLRTPLNLAVVLDRSGSMTGAKIEKARQAAIGLVDQLAPGDILSFVTYSDHAEVVLPAQQVEDKEALKERISRVHPGGSTALYDGVQAGADQIQKHFSAHRINRVILLSDGLANIGPSRPQDLRRLGGALSERGIAVTTIGVGDDYNEDLMAGLAEASDANYYYVKDTEKLPEIFARELGELIHVAARNVRIEITCPNGIKPIGLIGRSERFEGQKTTVLLSQFTVSQDRFVFLRCLVNEPKPEIARVKVSYTDELNGGNEDTISETAKIQFTEDKLMAANSVRAGVAAQKELWLTAIAKDEALADADAGRYQDAAQKLASQAKVLDQQYANAPAPMQSQLRQEAENLRQRSEQLRQNQYDAGTRKMIQNESWTTRNSKERN
jgi:Ca-activated chloride channel family protein